MKSFVCMGFSVALALAALPLRADPPPLVVGAAGPDVEIGGFPQSTVVSASERGLSVGFTDLSELIPPVDGGTEFVPNPVTIAFDVFRDAEAYRVTRTDETLEVAADGGARVQVRIGGSTVVLASATGPTLDAARAAALADAALDGIRARIVATDAVSAAPTVTKSEVTSSALTGRDQYVTTVIVFGPDESFRTRGGNLGLCTDFVTGCDGGTRVTIDDDITLFNTFTLNDLYITDTLTRTTTSVQNWFLDLTLSDPGDLLPITEGPVVQLGGGPVNSELIVSERGLASPVEDLADLVPVYRIGGVETQITLNDASSGQLGAALAARYAADGGSYDLPLTAEDQAFANSFGYTVTRSARTVEVAVDGGNVVQARIGASGPVLASAAGPTLDAARAAVLADMALDGIRAEIVATQTVAAAPTVTTVATTAALLTGRDTYQVIVPTFGPGTATVGNLGACATPVTDCEGGTEATVPDAIEHFNTVTLQDLYITDTLTRTTTTVQNWFLNLILSGGSGAPHAGAQAAGFEAGEGFLARLEGEAGVRSPVVSTSTSGGAPGAAGRLRFFAGASGGAGSFDRIGTVEGSDWSARGLTGGFAYTLSPEWTVGAGVEAGRWDWEGGGNEAEGDTRKVGLFAAWSRGPWQVTLAGFAGRHDVETEDALGVTADYKAEVRGASVTVGHDFAAGAWTVTPQAALRWVEWDAPRVTDSAGGTVAAVDAVQFRPELGLTARRSIEMERGAMDIGLDARVWTVEGDRVAVTSGGFVTDGPETGKVGGSLGLTADWRVAPATVLSARIETRFSEEGTATTAGLGLRVRF